MRIEVAPACALLNNQNISDVHSMSRWT